MNRLPIRYSSSLVLAAASVILAAGVAAPTARADTVVLKNGSRIEGTARRTAEGWTVTTGSGVATDLPADSVATIEVGSRVKPTTSTSEPTNGSLSAVTAESNLGSLRRSVEALNNPAIIIERYRRFIDQSAGTTAASEAKKDLAVWQDRQERGLVKVGTQWVTPEEKAAMAAHAGAIAAEAAKLLEQGRAQEAEPVLQSALDADAQNPAALYLRGVMLYAKDQIPPARKAFEATLAAAPDQGPALNNLGVILWKQNQPMAALQAYDRGMVASPVSKPILDNVAEALAAVPNDQRKNPIALKLAKRFVAQDVQMQQIMARSGQYRWGATWVDQATLEKLKAAEKEINEKLKQLTADATTAQTRIAEIEKQTAANNSTMSQLQATSYTRDTEGHAIQLPLPPAFYTLQNENERLATERATLQTKVQGLVEEAHRAQQAMPVPQYTGVQRLIGVEGMPGRVMPPPTTIPVVTTVPTTMPATEPSSVVIRIGPATMSVDPTPTTEPATAPSTEPSTQPAGVPVLIPLP